MPRTKNITCLIVDDNPFNIEVLADLLREYHPTIDILGRAENGTEAVRLIEQMQPDLVFLDVEMPDMNGFEVLASLKDLNFQTIFATAFSHYAIQAIRFNALDYLVKPIDPNDLHHAIKRFRSIGNTNNRLQIQNALENRKKKNVLDQVLFLSTQEGGIKMALRNIIKVEGERNYSTFHLSTSKTKLSSKTLGHFEDILKDKGFLRCHRSFIVNHYYIDRITKDSFSLKDGSSVPISRRRRLEAKEWFENHQA